MEKAIFFETAAMKIVGALTCLVCIAHGIELEPPTGWRIQSKQQPGMLFQYFEPSANPRFRANFLATRGAMPCCREESTPLDSLIAKAAGQQSRVFPQYKVLEKDKRKIGGRDGGFMVSSYARGEDDLACFQFFYLDGQEFVNVVYTCLLKDLPRMRPEFEKSLATLKTTR